MKKNNIFPGNLSFRNYLSLLSFIIILLFFLFSFTRISYALCENDCLKKERNVEIKNEVVKSYELNSFFPVPVGPISNIL